MSASIARGPTVAVRSIPPGESLKPFIDVAWTINASDPNWVPPLRMSMETVLDRKKHPFHRHAEVEYFIASRGDRDVGRIAAVINQLHLELHDDATGFFGFFECEDDSATARALFDASADWLRAKGMRRMRGPTNFSTNEEAASPGVLIEGFHRPPMVQMSHNPPYYRALLEDAGFQQAMDMVAFWFDNPNPTERAKRNLDRILERTGATIRTLDKRRFRREIDIIKEVYNAAWSANWGFVPMTDAEVEHMAREFKPVVDPELCLIAELNGEPIGFSLALPDLNAALRHLTDGRLLPLGIFKFLWYRRKITGLRVFTLGFKPGHQHSGLGVAFYLRGWQLAASKGYNHGEASWILQDNHEMVRALERMGAVIDKRYRVFDLAL